LGFPAPFFLVRARPPISKNSRKIWPDERRGTSSLTHTQKRQLFPS
jgi:hypothetical protein